jgi:hypothetical protein
VGCVSVGPSPGSALMDDVRSPQGPRSMKRDVRHLSHLVRRFVGSLSARAPSAADVAWALKSLENGERELWLRSSNPDQRHTIEVARRACRLMPSLTEPNQRPMLAGVLLHDIGKTESGLGTVGRVVATAWGALRGEQARSGGGKIATYLRHEPIGAELVTGVGSHPITIAVVGRSADVPPHVLAMLEDADEV